jgi:DHA2 family multidrug resistance protein
VLTSYLVANAIILPMGGWFSMLLGRKRFYMICVALFTISSFLCGLAPSLGALIFFRVLQGLGGGALQPVSQAILVESFPREKQGMAMAIFGMGVVVAPVIGPTLGGWITDNYSWRWIFFINIPIGILALCLPRLLIFDPPYLVRRTFAMASRSTTWASACWPPASARSRWCSTKARRKTGSPPTSS